MAYLVLSLKYRPQTFDEVIGQQHVTQTLTNAFAKDRVSQAYLFTGPRGVGKTTTARLVAKALNCMESPGIPCNKCSNCIEITDGRNMDVLEIDGASNRGIEEIRGLREAIQYSPINSKFKIFIIDEVHMLTTPAFNALLRTLEEPPAHGKFILATTDIYKVPATIISRCQRFDFNSISIQEICKQIKYVLEKEKITIDEESVKIIAQKADGSMRDALSILDQVIAYSGADITIDSLNKVLGLIPTNTYFNIFDAIKSKNGKVLIEILTDIKSKGMPIQEFISGLNRHTRNMMVGTIKNGLDTIEINSDLKLDYEEASESWDIKDLLMISKVITEIEPKIRRAIQPHILLELSLLKLLELDSAVSIESLIKKFESPLRIRPIAAPISKPKSSNDESKSATKIYNKVENVKISKIDKVDEKQNLKLEEPKIPSNIDMKIILEKWDEFIEELSSERPTIGTVLLQSEVNQMIGSRLEIKLINGNNFNLRTLENNKIVIEKYLEKIYAIPIKAVFLMTKSDAPKKKIKSEQENIKTNKIRDNLINLFDGEILN